MLRYVVGVASIVCTGTLACARPAVPDGERWKDLAGPDTLIGSLIGPGNALPIRDNAPFKVAHRSVLLRECNAATVPCFPFGTWKGPKKYDLSKFNELVNWLHENGCKPVAHLLVGPMHYYPDWYKKGKFTKAELEEMLEDYIREAITQNDNARKVHIWNVVNESLHGERGNRYRPGHWCALGWEEDASGLSGAAKVLGKHPVWVRKSFEYARKYTKGILEYRDNNCEFPDSRQDDGVYQLVRHLVKTGTPIDAVGFQLHMNLDRTYDWEGFKRLVEQYRDLGLMVNVTEIDVRAAITTSQDAERQRRQYYDVVKSCREAGVTLINFWGLRDGSGGPKSEDALLFEESPTYDPKPAYYGVQQALMETRRSGAARAAAPEAGKPDAAVAVAAGAGDAADADAADSEKAPSPARQDQGADGAPEASPAGTPGDGNGGFGTTSAVVAVCVVAVAGAAVFAASRTRRRRSRGRGDRKA